MNEKLAQAMNAIRDRYIADAAGAKKNHRRIWLGAAAAVLALVICFRLVSGPLAVSVKAVSTPGASRFGAFPSRGDYTDTESWDADAEKWRAQWDTKYASVDAARESLQPFFTESCREFLSGGSGENRVWSPVNGYIALAMLAEITGGETRQQILTLLGADSLELLREQVSAVWETVCQDSDDTVCRLANSLWLDRDMSYHQEVMDSLAYYHYASVYQGDLGTEQTNQALREWVDDNTGRLLTDYTGGISLSPATVLALFSTVYLQALWTNPFSPEDNTEAPFYAPSGEILCTYMNKRESPMPYYQGSRFGAVSLSLRSGRMWLILPEEGCTPEALLSEGQYLELTAQPYTYAGMESVKVNLSMPKFDVSSSSDLTGGLQNLGIAQVFDPEAADFSPSLGSAGPFSVSAVRQASRVTVDEEGVRAAGFIGTLVDGAGLPPEKTIDFVLDRPFLFVITASNNLPLFVGVVNQP